MFKLGVLSDTHIPRRRKIPDIVFGALQDVDLIVHAGDILDYGVLNRLSKIAPVEAVAGNVDTEKIKGQLGRKKILTLQGLRIGLVHGDEGYGKNTLERALSNFEQEKPDCIIFGHSHIPFNDYRNDILMFNPGSPTDPRRQPMPSFGIIKINNIIEGQIIYIDGDELIH